MPTIRTNSNDIRPAVHFALAIIVIAHSNHGSVCLQAYGMPTIRTNSNDIRPAVHFALAIIVIAHSNHGSIGL